MNILAEIKKLYINATEHILNITSTENRLNLNVYDGIPEAPDDGKAYARQSKKWQEVEGITVDDTVTEESENPVKSSGIWAWVTGLLATVWAAINKLLNNLTLTNEPTGIKTDDPYNETLAIRFNDSTMKLEVDGAFQGYLRGDLVLDVAEGETWESPTLELIDGVKGYYLTYCPTTEAFTWVRANGFDFRCVMLAFCYFRSTGEYLFTIREAHGFMPWQNHAAEHQTVGTILDAGGDLSGYVLNSTIPDNRRPLVSATKVRDEDIKTANAALTERSYTVAWLSGDAATSLPAQADIVQLDGGIPQLNTFDGTNWVLSDLSNNYFMSVWVIAMPVADDAKSQRYKYIWWAGQSQSSTIEEQQARSFRDLELLDFTNISPEFVPVGRIIIRRLGGNWQLAAVEKITGSRAQQLQSPVGNFLSAVSTSNEFTGNGTPSAPMGVNAIAIEKIKRLVYSDTLTEFVKSIEITEDNDGIPLDLDKFCIYLYHPEYSIATTLLLTINDLTAGYDFRNSINASSIGLYQSNPLIYSFHQITFDGIGNVMTGIADTFYQLDSSQLNFFSQFGIKGVSRVYKISISTTGIRTLPPNTTIEIWKK